MAAMGHDGPSLTFDFRFPFQNKSILIKSNLINKTRQQMKNTIQKLNQFGFGYQFEM